MESPHKPLIDDDNFSLDGTTGNGDYTSGGTWTRITGASPTPKVFDSETGAQGRTHFSLLVDPTNEDILYLGGDRQEQPSSIGDDTFGGAIFRGDASIAANPTLVPSPQWDHITHDQVGFDPPGGTANGTAPHADSREMVFDARALHLSCSLFPGHRQELLHSRMVMRESYRSLIGKSILLTFAALPRYGEERNSTVRNSVRTLPHGSHRPCQVKAGKRRASGIQ